MTQQNQSFVPKDVSITPKLGFGGGSFAASEKLDVAKAIIGKFKDDKSARGRFDLTSLQSEGGSYRRSKKHAVCSVPQTTRNLTIDHE